jgi:hypothetical protein
MRLETFVSKLYKVIRERREQVSESILYSTDSWEKYQNLVGQLKSIDLLNQDVKDLLKGEEDDFDITRASGEKTGDAE